MKNTAKILFILGLIVLFLTVVSRFFLGRPFSLLGVRALSLLIISNTLFLMAVFAKLSEKK